MGQIVAGNQRAQQTERAVQFTAIASAAVSAAAVRLNKFGQDT
jgi:hypothetical protein